MRLTRKKFGKYFALSAFCFSLIFFIFGFAIASTTDGTIDSTYKYAWCKNTGWLNFGDTDGNIHITDSGFTGYAWDENYGWINMNPTNSGVEVSASGALSGSAWGENVGWINFSGVSIDCSGVFSGNATGDYVGVVTFDCTNCDVRTDYRPINCRGGGGPEPVFYHNSCSQTTHQCVKTVGEGVNECETVDDWCCDPHGDLNWDRSINLTDFSILMYYWGQTPPTWPCPDINKDGTVDLTDFSIMLYWWTG